MTRVARLLTLTLLALPLPAVAQVRFDERVDVVRVLIDARVVDPRGRPVAGLRTEDFRVEIDGHPARIERAAWVGEAGAVESLKAAPAHPGAKRESGAGRLVVFMFQHSLEPGRIGGMLNMMRESARFVDRLGPNDRAAVVVFDSRLRLWQDFTSDRDRLRRVLGSEILNRPSPGGGGDGVSLAGVLDPARGAKAATPEAALLVLAEALDRIEGAKSLVLFGYGFGDFRPTPGNVLGMAVRGKEYDRARDALVAARVTVFALDITVADAHTLESGLMAVAEDTGGFYSRTHLFPALAMDRLEGALAGYYVLSVEKPRRRTGRHEISVRAQAPHTTVSARRYYVD